MKIKYNDLINQGMLLELLEKIIDGFYFDEDYKKMIAFVMVSKSQKYDSIRKKIKKSERIIANIRKNIMIENYKHALHLIIMLNIYVKKIRMEISYI